MNRPGFILLTVAAITLVYLAVAPIVNRRGAHVEPGPAVSAGDSFDPAPASEPNDPPPGNRTANEGPATTSSGPDSEGASTNRSRFDPATYRYPAKAGQLGKLGDFVEREVEVFQHPDGSIRVHRLIETEMKYPFVLVEEVFSRESGALARQRLSVGDHLMVQFVSGTERSVIEAAVQDAGFTVRKWFQQPGLVLVEIPDAGINSLEESLGKISTHPQIEFAERDDLVFAD